MATANLTPDNDAIVAEVFIAAPPARVFEAIADPKQLTQWWGKKGVFRVVESKYDLRPGGKWSYEGLGPNEGPFHMEGEYLEVDPPRLLVQTRRADWVGDFETIVRWELEPREVHGLHGSGTHKVGTGTLVRVRHSGFAGHREQARAHHQGWSAGLDWLKAFVEKGEIWQMRD
ncbi:MAG TPA: SRPBCC domain-containing protein [Terriglobales bacterium]|nr:SRPBCC domain-containing protein [Terriglobales bacterium]